MKQTWETNINYKVNDLVIIYDIEYICLIDHISNIFGNDRFGDLFPIDKKGNSLPPRYPYWKKT